MTFKKKKIEKKDFWVHCRPRSPSHTADQVGVLLPRAILPLYDRQNSHKVSAKLSVHGKPNLNHWSKHLPRQGRWLCLENTAVQRLQFPGNRAAFVSNRSPRITVTGVPTAEETRAKPLTDAGSGQCYHHVKAPMDKIKPLRTATRSHSTFSLTVTQICPVTHFYPNESFCSTYLQHVTSQKFFSNKYSQ